MEKLELKHLSAYLPYKNQNNKMKKLLILALCFMATNLKAQTVLINGQQYNQNETVVITTQYANIEVISPAYVTDVSVTYVGATAYYVPDFTTQRMVINKPKLLRVNWFNGTKKVATYRVYLKRQGVSYNVLQLGVCYFALQMLQALDKINRQKELITISTKPL